MPVRCRAQLITGSGSHDVETEDIGPLGCQIVAPLFVHRGEPVRVLIFYARIHYTLTAAGRIAWASPQPPFRLGIAFDERSLLPARRFYEKVLEEDPSLTGQERVPQRLALDAFVFLGSPPRLVVDFSLDETAILRTIGSGVKVGDLKVKSGTRWAQGERALYSLMAQNYVTVNRGQSVHPEAWKTILGKVEAMFLMPNRAANRTNAADPKPASSDSAGAAPGSSKAAASSVAAPPPGANTTARSPEAQACFERGLKEQAAGQLNTARALLRRASQLAPGDVEIQKALSQITFGQHS